MTNYIEIEVLDYKSLERITNKRCATCKDKLAPWESVVCCICEALAEDEE